MPETLFLKLGGSLVTDKTGVEALRADVVARLAAEIAAARRRCPEVALVLGHGGGSFGHVAAARHQTRQGVANAAQWLGFAEVHAAMVRLNRLLVAALLAEDVPAFGIPPALLVQCVDGEIVQMNAGPIQQALAAGLVPVIFGDVAFDSGRGGTIVSTEAVMAALVGALRPLRLLLAGETEGVYDQHGAIIPVIDGANVGDLRAALGGSRGTDVTGGMAAKVEGMLALVTQYPDLRVRIFSGLTAGLVVEAVCGLAAVGSEIRP